MFRKQKVEKLKKFMKKFKLFAVILLVGAMGITSVSAQTTNDLLAQIQALQVQVSNLQSQLLRSVQGGSQTFVSSTILTVTKSGTGTGLVWSIPAGINCGSDCSESYASGTSVWLYANPSGGSTFVNWTGCDSFSSSGDCRVTMNYDRTVNARFNLVQNTAPSIDYLSGPTRLTINAVGTWTARASDVDGNLMRWDIFWGDNSSSSRSASSSSSMVMLDHSYTTTGSKNIVFKIWDTNWAYDIASTTVNIISPNIKRTNYYQQGSIIESAKQQLDEMTLKLQEILRQLR